MRQRARHLALHGAGGDAQPSGVRRQLASVDEVVLPDGSPGDYDLGMIARPWRGYRCLSHPGAVMGGVSEAFALPELELDVVLLANCSDLAIKSLAQQVADAVTAPGAAVHRQQQRLRRAAVLVQRRRQAEVAD